MKRAFAFLTTVLLGTSPGLGFAAPECASVVDQAALKTAALQQELMVAALRCHDVNEYNQFVLSHRNELISSDNALKAYFQRDDKLRGMATYNKYKTELANAASLLSSQDLDSFCGAAAHEFDSALRPESLSRVVAHVDLIAGDPGSNCPVLAENGSDRAIATTRAPRQPYAPDERDTVIGPSGPDRDWYADDEDSDNEDFDDNGDNPDDTVAPQPYPMVDDDADR